ncbi:MAG: hypothetical protein C3F11_09640 [Methylocystaceae bacterium]|nr:MAG: hypothetical protein C3F11_09640 [Methylocystaceae bacterium]
MIDAAPALRSDAASTREAFAYPIAPGFPQTWGFCGEGAGGVCAVFGRATGFAAVRRAAHARAERIVVPEPPLRSTRRQKAAPRGSPTTSRPTASGAKGHFRPRPFPQT